MNRTWSVRLETPAHEMAQEEILKQVAFLSRELSSPHFGDGGAVLQFDAPADLGDGLAAKAAELSRKVQRGLRSLQRKVVYRSKSMASPTFHGDGPVPGVQSLGVGQVALRGVALRLYRYFDRVFEELGALWRAEPVLTPTLIPIQALAKCDYLRSFPHNVTFACHLHEDPSRVDDFRTRHVDREELDDKAFADMRSPEACLSPAVCYHTYHMHQGQTLPAEGAVYGVCGRCFRYESTNLSDLRRLWDFTMREIVFLGARDLVLRERERGNGVIADFLESHELAGEIRTASDPFFIAPDAVAKTYFQLSSDTKYEISLALPNDARLAVGSLNYHTDFFGRAFNVSIDGAGPMQSVCIAFGLERWVYAFLAQHGDDPAGWPEIVRRAREFAAGPR
jgi:seryl-tRNA synthetase